MNNKKYGFLWGWLWGVLSLVGFLILMGATPKHQLHKDQLDAINHGYAEWVLSTNGNPPTIEFQWK